MILMMNRSAQNHETVREGAERTDNADDDKAGRSPLQKDFLPYEFQPGEWDVICHSGKDPKSHVGNRRFKVLIQNYLPSYLKAESRVLKSTVISDIISVIRSKSTHNGGFVRFDETAGRWYEVGDKVARDKVGHSLREALRMSEEQSTPESKKSGSLIEALVLPSSATRLGSPPIFPDVATASAHGVMQPTVLPQQRASDSSSNLGTISSAEAHPDKEDITPVAMNLADWFEADSMDES